MSLRVDHSSPTPLYYQIREQLRQQILAGELQPGDPVPSEAEISAQCGVSRMTARLALTHLANEGLVVRKPGRGTFVAPPKATFHEIPSTLSSYTEIVRRLGLRARAQVRAQEVIPAPRSVAEHLQIPVGDPVVRIVRIRYAGDEPMSLETSHYPYERFPELARADLTDRSIYEVLHELHGVALAHAVDTTELSVAGAYEARELGVTKGIPVVLCTRVGYLDDDTPAEYTQTVHRGDRFRSVVRVTREDLLRM